MRITSGALHQHPDLIPHSIKPMPRRTPLMQHVKQQQTSCRHLIYLFVHVVNASSPFGVLISPIVGRGKMGVRIVRELSRLANVSTIIAEFSANRAARSIPRCPPPYDARTIWRRNFREAFCVFRIREDEASSWRDGGSADGSRRQLSHSLTEHTSYGMLDGRQPNKGRRSPPVNAGGEWAEPFIINLGESACVK
jgi:hypothetical protein